MGSLSAKPVIDSKASMLEPPAAWLDRMLASLTAGPGQSHDADHDAGARRLSQTPLEAILSAIDRAKPRPTASAQIALYTRWIEANAAGAPLLHAAWFNLGVLFAEAGDRTNAATAYGNSLALRPDMHAARDQPGPAARSKQPAGPGPRHLGTRAAAG